MGHHYLPQYYLRGFVIDNDLLWAYEKELVRNTLHK